MSDRLEKAINYLRMQGVEVIRLPSGFLVMQANQAIDAPPSQIVNLAQQQGWRG